MHRIVDRHMMLTYYFKYALLYWTIADVRDYDMWEVRWLFRYVPIVRQCAWIKLHHDMWCMM